MRAMSLAMLKAMPGYVYLGTPYTKFEGGIDEACRLAQTAAGRLMEQGLVIYSPIAHSHGIARASDVDPLDWAFWQRHCTAMMGGASAIIALKLKGWGESVGLKYELEAFAYAGKPIVYLEPEEVGL